MYRQGDLLIVASREPVGERRMVADCVLLHGEVTGHSHRVIGGEVYDVWGLRYVAANQDTKVVHEEHHEIALPEGTYRVFRQREYDEGMIRYVTD